MSLSKDSKLLPLNPIVVDNLIRVGGRIGQSHLPFEQKHQILLTKEHFLSTLLVLDKHERNYHIGREQTLSLLRESVWIIKSKHQYERSYRIVVTQSPIMSNLPKARLAINQPPFTNTGIDYFVPLTVKQGRCSRSTDETSKRYGAIFTCLSIRAVHIELAGNLSTDNFILALRRSISRRGHPKNIFSNNETNFTGAQREHAKSLKSLDQNRIEAELTPQKIVKLQ